MASNKNIYTHSPIFLPRPRPEDRSRGYIPSHMPTRIRPAPITRINTSANSQPGMRPSSPVMGQLCQAEALAGMSQITWMADQLAKSFAGEGQPSGQGPSSAVHIRRNHPSQKLAHASSLAGQSFATRRTVHAPRGTPGPAKGKMGEKISRDRTTTLPYAARGVPTFLHIPDFQNHGFQVRRDACDF